MYDQTLRLILRSETLAQHSANCQDFRENTVMSEQIRSLVIELNEAWQAGNWDKVGEFYHPDAVLLPPDTGEPIVGRTAILETYRQFASAARLIAFEIEDLTVFSYPGTSMVHMSFAAEYELEGTGFEDRGLEIYAVDTASSRIVWRNQIILATRTLQS